MPRCNRPFMPNPHAIAVAGVIMMVRERAASHAGRWLSVAVAILLAGSSATRAAPAHGGTIHPRVLWQVMMPGVSTTNYVTVAPDGTIYANNGDRLLAVDADGSVLWERPNTGQDYARPINVDDEGRIYTGGLGSGQITALEPDGSPRWTYTPDAGAGLLAGPSLGPDGNVYAIADDLGTYAVDGNGDLLWIGEYEISTSLNNAPLVFDDHRFFAGIDHSGGFPSLHVYDRSDGSEIWGSAGLGIPWNGYPAIDPAGRVIGRRWTGWIQALDPADGEVLWFTQHPGVGQVLAWPAVGTDGAIYTGDSFGLELWSLAPDGSTRWVLPAEDGSMLKVDVAPDDSTVITSGWLGVGYVRGYDPEDGSLLWHIELPDESGLSQYVSGFEVAFSADSRTAYVVTNFAGSEVDHGYLYAITLDPPVIFADGFESGDTSAWSTTTP